jgi:hypothetical protein
MNLLYKTLNSKPSIKLMTAIAAIFLATFSQLTYAQCACDATVALPSNDWPATTTGQTVCLTGTGGFPANGNRPDNVCIAPDANVTVFNDLNGNQWNITVYGKLNYQPQNLPERSTVTIKSGGEFVQTHSSMGANGQNTDETKLIIESGANAKIAATDIGNLITLQNAGSVELTTNSKVDFKGLLNNSGTITTSTGNDNAILLINPGKTGAAITNSGTINVANFENHVAVGGASFENSGSITARGVLYTHGRMTTTSTGTLNTTCEIATNPFGGNVPANTSFYVGDKEAGSFISSGVFNICGNAVMGGLTVLNGASVYIAGDLNLVKGISGNNGKLQVGGTATSTTSEGTYSGTNFLFYSPSGTGIQNYPSTGANYTISNNALPVKLQNFQVTLSEGAVAISWTTTEETNSQNFEVQRSYDAKNWTVIANVKALGNHVGPKLYNHVDTDVVKATNYYRLKMVDLDGKFAYSTIKSVQTKNAAKVVAYVFPNPASDKLYISAENKSGVKSVFIYTGDGKLALNAGKVTNNEINIKSLPVGKYMVRVIYNDKSMKVSQVLVNR